jgi:hypothetical protein
MKISKKNNFNHQTNLVNVQEKNKILKDANSNMLQVSITTSFSSLPETTISCSLSMSPNRLTETSTFKAFQENPNPLNLTLPDCMNNSNA